MKETFQYREFYASPETGVSRIPTIIYLAQLKKKWNWKEIFKLAAKKIYAPLQNPAFKNFVYQLLKVKMQKVISLGLSNLSSYIQKRNSHLFTSNMNIGNDQEQR